MTPEGIQSGEDLSAWLEALPSGTEAERDRVQRLAVAIAYRAAMRLLPVHLLDGNPGSRLRRELEGFASFRLNLISGVAAVCPTPEIQSRAAAAVAAGSRAAATFPTTLDDAAEVESATWSYATDAEVEAILGIVIANFIKAEASCPANVCANPSAIAAGEVASAVANVNFANLAVVTADAAEFHAIFWDPVAFDCIEWSAGRTLESRPLWPDPNTLQEFWANIRAAWLAKGSGWDFWVDWYDKALAGDPQDWGGLLTEVALIPAEEWDKGADHVNARIADIRLKHAVKATPNAEVVSFNEATGRFRVDQISEMPGDHLADAVEKLRNVLSLFDGAQERSNELLAIEPERVIIAEAVERYAERPRMLHNSCVRVLRRLDIKMANGECPDRTSDADIADIYETVRAVSVDLVERDPLVKEAVAQMASVRLRDVAPAEAEVLVKAADEVAAASEGVLAEELPENVRLAIDPNAPPTERKEALYMTISRLLRVWLIWGCRGTKATLKEIESVTSTVAGIATNVAKIAGLSAAMAIPVWLEPAISIILRLL